jgi:hypothetical protein
MFAVIRHGELTEEKIPTKCHFQSQNCLDLFEAGQLDEDLMFLIVPIHDTGTVAHAFYFDDRASKQAWLSAEITVVKEDAEN